jgi:hypothetical protein
MLNLDFLLEGTKAQFDLDGFGDDLFVPALEALLDSLTREAELDDERITRTSFQLMLALSERATLQKAFTADLPPIQGRPIFITGLLRTGTTMLHNMLSRHPEHYAPKLWNLRSPLRPKDADADWEEQQLAATRMILDAIYEMAPDFQKIHPMNERWPDECSWLFRRDFASLVYSFTYYTPSYARWLLQTRMEPYYRSYQRSLRAMQYLSPGARWVMKDPCHLWHLDALLEVFPEASVIVLHRDLNEALPSLASLFFATHRVGSRRQDPTQLAPYCMELVEQGFQRMIKAREAHPRATIINLRYRDLVAQPKESLRSLCASLDSRTDDAALAAMTSWLTENQQHKHGKHNYSLEQFGFSRNEIDAKLGFYQDEFLR